MSWRVENAANRRSSLRGVQKHPFRVHLGTPTPVLEDFQKSGTQSNVCLGKQIGGEIGKNDLNYFLGAEIRNHVKE